MQARQHAIQPFPAKEPKDAREGNPILSATQALEGCQATAANLDQEQTANRKSFACRTSFPRTFLQLSVGNILWICISAEPLQPLRQQQAAVHLLPQQTPPLG